MASKSCIIITKYFLFVFNLFFFFLGGVMLGFGLWILFDKTSFIAVLDSASVPLQLWSYLLSGLGIFTMMMGFLGCIGALKEVKCMLGIYFTFLVFLMASQIIIGVLVNTQRKMIEKKVSVAVEDLIKNYNRGDDKSENLEESWDFIQLKFSCCGWNRFDEWLNNPIISKNISKESLLNFDTHFNFSCSCHNSFSKNLTHNVTKETGFCLTHGNLQRENSQGCKRNVFQWMQQNIISIMIICVGITVVEFLQFLCISLNRRRTEHTAREDHPVLPTRASYLEYWQGVAAMKLFPLWMIGILVGMFRDSTEFKLPSEMTQDYSEGLQNSRALLCEVWKHNEKRVLKKSGHQRSPYILKRQLRPNNKWPYILWHFLGLPVPAS